MLQLKWLLFVSIIAGQDASAPVVVPLHASAETPVSIAAFQSWGATQCDAHGNLYFRVGANFNQTAIRRLAPDATTDTYTVPSEYANSTTYVDFRANPEGDVHVLVADKNSSLHVFSYKAESSSNPVHIRLDAPPHINATSFAVFVSGNILLSGFYDEAAPENLRGKPYAAEFDSSGRFRLALDTHVPSIDPTSPPAALGATSALNERGSLYLAQGSELLEISEIGEIERKLVLQKPAPDYAVGHIQVSGGRVGIWFVKAEAQRPITLRLSVLDPLSGHIALFYEPDSELGNNAVCFTGDAFLFQRVRNRFMRIVKASVR